MSLYRLTVVALCIANIICLLQWFRAADRANAYIDFIRWYFKQMPNEELSKVAEMYARHLDLLSDDWDA